VRVFRSRFKPKINEILIDIRKLIDLYKCKINSFIYFQMSNSNSKRRDLKSYKKSNNLDQINLIPI